MMLVLKDTYILVDSLCFEVHISQIVSRFEKLFDGKHSISESVTVLKQFLISDHCKKLDVACFLVRVNIFRQELRVVGNLNDFDQKSGCPRFSDSIIALEFLLEALKILVCEDSLKSFEKEIIGVYIVCRNSSLALRQLFIVLEFLIDIPSTICLIWPEWRSWIKQRLLLIRTALLLVNENIYVCITF